MLQNNYDPYDKTLDEFTTYLERLEQAAKFSVNNNVEQGEGNRGKKRKAKKSTQNDSAPKGLHKCKYCKKMVTHNDEDCWEKPGNENKKPSWISNKRHKGESHKKKKAPMFSGEQINFLIENAHLVATKDKKVKKVKKRQVKFTKDSSSEEESYEESHAITSYKNNDSDESVTDTSETVNAYFLSSLHNKKKKKLKTGHLVTEVVGEIVTSEKETKIIRCLLDSGTTSTIVLKAFVTNSLVKTKQPVSWKTMGGTFETGHKSQVTFKMPEFSHNRTVTWEAHVDDHSDPKMTNYDLIIGSDLMTELKIILNYDSQTVIWDEVAIPMKQSGTLTDKKRTQDIYEFTKE